MVDVTIDNYEKILPDCVRHIQNSDFVAIGTCFLSFFFLLLLKSYSSITNTNTHRSRVYGSFDT